MHCSSLPHFISPFKIDTLIKTRCSVFTVSKTKSLRGQGLCKVAHCTLCDNASINKCPKNDRWMHEWTVTSFSDVILFGLYSNPLTCAARLFSSPLDKNKTPKPGRLCKCFKVRGSLTTGDPSSYPQTHSSSSHSSPEHGWVIELGGKKVWKWPWKPQSQSR